MEQKNESKQKAEKAGESKLSPQESLMIPKHRFDCVNLCLKDTKEALIQTSAQADAQKIRIDELEKSLVESKVETILAQHRAKNLTAVKALIDFSILYLDHDGNVPKAEEQVLALKKSQHYMFEESFDTAYVLVPVKSGEPLHKSIINHININNRRVKK
ncbi:MAG: phage scaffolding protein [Firmicutes bacterium]|nr:phage scaffolding protein [Bacillota bacterium]